MSRFHDDRTAASDPVPIRLSVTKLRALEPRPDRGVPDAMVDEHLGFGDSRAAVVAQVAPLVVAAYTDELDCVVLLRFPPALVEEHHLEVGSRLLTINTYRYRDEGLAPDLTPGERDTRNYGDVHPCIAEFLSDELGVIEERKAAIDEAEWRRAERMGQRALREGAATRRGGPYTSGRAARAGGRPAPTPADPPRGGQDWREAEVEARARITWGHDRARVEAFLRERGVPAERIRAVVSEAGRDRDWEFRRTAIVDLVLATLIGGPMLWAWLVASRDGGVVTSTQLAIIIFAAWLGGQGASRLVLGGQGESGTDNAPDALRDGFMRWVKYGFVLLALVAVGVTLAEALT